MIVSLIAAVSDNNVIGNKGKIPWHISEDFRHFKKITSGHCVVMGQNTYLSLGKPLPDRTNIILSLDPKFTAPGCFIFNSPEKALDYAENSGEAECFIIGGGQIYKLFINLADKIYLTRVRGNFPGDTYFPEINMSEWNTETFEKHPDFEFLELTRVLSSPKINYRSDN